MAESNIISALGEQSFNKVLRQYMLDNSVKPTDENVKNTRSKLMGNEDLVLSLAGKYDYPFMYEDRLSEEEIRKINSIGRDESDSDPYNISKSMDTDTDEEASEPSTSETA